MERMTSQQIRQSFIEFFQKKEHTFVPGSPVIPADDPTLLFTNAGMNQFKDILLGKGRRSYKRAVNSQKCIRVSGKHNDLEEVGHDTYHHTFFEMLGNWSFGDYYKEEAIAWAWELLTRVWELPGNQLYATVFREDDEAANIWTKVTDISADRMLRFDEKDNFWEMGNTGPCGPCSEIHIDLGPERCNLQGKKHNCSVNGDCGRFIELWNLVFIQYNRDQKGKLTLLPDKHVDTGAGFERLVAVLQKKYSNYDTDLFKPIIEKISTISGLPYDQSQEKSAYHVIADHIRMLSFSIADGGFPSNEGRGYVIRRILRRAARYGRKLNMHEAFIYRLVKTVGDILGDTFPEIRERAGYIENVIKSEEEHFNRTLDRGLEIFTGIRNELESQGKRVMPGSDVFKLYDTYGFPADLTAILAQEAGLEIDHSGFEKAMHAQKERARKSAKFKKNAVKNNTWIKVMEDKSSNFVGYNEDAIETHIVKYSIHADKLYLVLKDTPFYAESGGQVGDQGTINMEGLELAVMDTQKEGDDIVHICDLPEGFSKWMPLAEVRSDRVIVEINIAQRRDTEKNHTSTHLLHKTLRKVLGDHVQQSGSLVTPQRLRFDFTHFEKINQEQLQEIEQIVNSKIQEDIELVIRHESFNEAKKRGAMALFGEKYGEIVRTIQIPGFSFELCGGTHVRRTGQIGSFIIIYEGSIAAGMRRIEALTGSAAVHYLQKSRSIVAKLADLLNSRDEELVNRISGLLSEKKEMEKKIESAASQSILMSIDDILKSAESINGINVITCKLSDLNINQLKEMGDRIREKSKNTVALLGTEIDDKLNFVCIVSDDLIKNKNLHAGNVIKEVAKVTGGGGGGKSHMATAGGKDIKKFDQAMDKIKELISKIK
jgi:alanyl-tRNA synthetase